MPIMALTSLLFLVVCVQIDKVTPVIHTLRYFRTASTDIAGFPAYIEVGYVDGVEFTHYDSESKKVEAKQDWMKSFAVDNPDYWEMAMQKNVVNEHVFLVNIGIAKERFNHTGGVHIIQWMFGCDWNDETNETDGCNQHSYDGQDFIALDTKTMTYVAANPQAVITKLKWNRDQARKEYRKHYYTEICPSLLRRLVNYGQKVLMRTELPKVSLLQKTPSSPVTCHASGFYPDMADLFWRKNGEQLHEDVNSGQTLSNHDGTFQMTVDLKLEVTDEVEGQYECVFQLAGVKGEIVTKLEKRNIQSNARNEAETRKKIVTIAALLVVVTVVIVVVIVVVIMRLLKCSRDIDTPSSSDGDFELSRESERQMLSKTNGPTQDGGRACTDCVPLTPAGLNGKVTLTIGILGAEYGVFHL